MLQFLKRTRSSTKISTVWTKVKTWIERKKNLQLTIKQTIEMEIYIQTLNTNIKKNCLVKRMRIKMTRRNNKRKLSQSSWLGRKRFEWCPNRLCKNRKPELLVCSRVKQFSKKVLIFRREIWERINLQYMMITLNLNRYKDKKIVSTWLFNNPKQTI